MEFDKIENDKYYCFGCRFLKPNGEIDYKELAEELDETKYYYAAMMFEAEDLGFNLRMQVYSPARWIFEAGDYETSKEDFENFVGTETFKRFADVVPGKIQAALGALQTIDENELKKNGIKKEDVDKMTKNSLRIMTIVKAACKNPTMKESK